MSTLQTINVKHPSSASNNIVLDSSGNATIAGSMVAGSSYAWRNRIINGDMRIDQRNAGASVTLTNNVGYALDRFRSVALGTSLGFSTVRSTTAPTSFVNSLLATVTTAKTPASSDQARINQYIEGFNVADLAWGTASAQTVTLSFWVRSSVTGTYCVSFTNADSATRSLVATYTINAANTFEYKTITVLGDTSGTWTTGNSVGLGVSFSLGCGSSFNAASANTWYGAEYHQTSAQTNWIANSGATFYLTGVQLEVGTVATPFERRDYGRELILCQRYCQKSYPTGTAPGTTSIGGYAANGGLANGTFNARSSIRFAVEMRAAPTLSYWDYVGNASRASSWNTGNTRTDNVSSASFALTDIGTSGFLFNDAGGAGNAGAGACSSGVHWLATSEL